MVLGSARALVLARGAGVTVLSDLSGSGTLPTEHPIPEQSWEMGSLSKPISTGPSDPSRRGTPGMGGWIIDPGKEKAEETRCDRGKRMNSALAVICKEGEGCAVLCHFSGQKND